MYVRRVAISHVRSISHLEWSVEPGKEAGWHVIIGDNGSGKSSFLRSIALALVGEKDAEALRQDWDTWLSRGAESGEVELKVWADAQWDHGSGPSILDSVQQILRDLDLIELVVKESAEENPALASKALEDLRRRAHALVPLDRDPNTSLVWINFLRTARAVEIESNLTDLPRTPSQDEGWFSAGYGPFRRFSGGTESERIVNSRPRLAAHLSVFGEDFALTESIRWLQELQLRKLENPSATVPHFIDQVTEFTNQPGFLPHRTQLHEIGSAGVQFRDGNGHNIRVEDLSDGYRSVLSMAFDLLRQLSFAYPPHRLFSANDPSRVQVPGVVMIDEVDAHLHPTWQKRIGKWLTDHFPKIQFIVTTHSPLICQAASTGSVWRLPRPGTNDIGGRVEGTDLERLVYGNVLDAYGTDLFGEDVSRSEESKQLLQRLAELNRKERQGTLSNQEREEQHRLRSILPTAADTVKTAEDLAA